MQENEDIYLIRTAVHSILGKDSTGHDYYHALRVAQTGRFIALREHADPIICEIAGLVHDIGRPLEKAQGIPHWGPDALQVIEELFQETSIERTVQDHVLTCVAEHEQYSFLGADAPSTLESRVLQDADRLDAIGAIGIARTFMFAGAHGHALYLPEQEPRAWSPATQSTDAISHFHEKLFPLVEGMHTPTGRKLALTKQQVMEGFLESFMEEWEGAGHES